MFLPGYTRIAGLIGYHQAIPSFFFFFFFLFKNPSSTRSYFAAMNPRGPLHPKVGSSTIPIDGSEYSGSICTRLFLVYLIIAVFIYCGQLALSLLFSRNSSISASVTGFGSSGMACTTSTYELEWTLI
jgi:hypothetical protein